MKLVGCWDIGMITIMKNEGREKEADRHDARTKNKPKNPKKRKQETPTFQHPSS
jgi:hypothetical protein